MHLDCSEKEMPLAAGFAESFLREEDDDEDEDDSAEHHEASLFVVGMDADTLFLKVAPTWETSCPFFRPAKTDAMFFYIVCRDERR
jgi:hypothetical protein